jgi:hypothetical protein
LLTDGQTDGQTDRQSDYYRAPAISGALTITIQDKTSMVLKGQDKDSGEILDAFLKNFKCSLLYGNGHTKYEFQILSDTY